MKSILGIYQGGPKAIVIAEAGVNHNGSPELAHRLVDAAVSSGADIVKFQTFNVEKLVSNDAAVTPYQRANGVDTQKGLLESLTLPLDVWSELRDHADAAGIGFLSTPFDLESAELLEGLVEAYKVSSGELTNLGFIRSLATLDKPLLLSTGMGDFDEVERALSAAQEAPAIGLFHCVSAYPTPEDQTNLLAIPAMFDAFEVPVGWSDHTLGTDAAVATAALGGRLFEKHLTLDNKMSGPDHQASLEPAAFKDYVDSIRKTLSMLGDGQKKLMPCEVENAHLVRRSWHARRSLRAGEVVRADDFIALRPEDGLHADIDPEGSRVLRDIKAGEALRADNLEGITVDQ